METHTTQGRGKEIQLTVRVTLDSGREEEAPPFKLPYSLHLSYSALTPKTSPDTPLSLSVSLSDKNDNNNGIAEGEREPNVAGFILYAVTD